MNGSPLQDVYRKHGRHMLELARTDPGLSAAIDQVHAGLVADAAEAQVVSPLEWYVYLLAYSSGALRLASKPEVARRHPDTTGYSIIMVQVAAACRIGVEQGILGRDVL